MYVLTAIFGFGLTGLFFFPLSFFLSYDLMTNLKALDFTIRSEWEPFWVFLVLGSSFSSLLIDHATPSGLQCFCWEINRQPYEDSVLCYVLLFPCFFETIFSLIFANLINVCLGSSLGLSCLGLCFLDLSDCFLSPMKQFFSYYLSSYFLRPFISPSGTPIMLMLVHLMLSQRSLRLSSFFFILFSLLFSKAVISVILSSSSLNHSLFCHWFLLVYFSFQVLYCSSVCFFFRSSPY